MLHPEIQSIVDAVEAGPPAHLVPLDDLRTAQAVEAVRLAGPGEEVAEVREVEIPGPGGPIGVRVYRPEGEGPLEQWEPLRRLRALADGAGGYLAPLLHG